MKVKFKKSSQALKRYSIVSIGRFVLSIVHVHLHNGNMKVLHYETCFLDPNKNLTEEDLQNFIQGFFDKHYILDTDVVISVDDVPGLVIRKVLLPAMLYDHEIVAAIQWKLIHETLIDSENYFVGWKALQWLGKKDVDGEQPLLAVLCDKECAQKYLGAVEKSKLTSTVMTHSVFYWQELFDDLSEDEGLRVVLDFQYSYSNILFYKGEELVFVRSLPVSFERFFKLEDQPVEVKNSLGQGTEPFVLVSAFKFLQTQQNSDSSDQIFYRSFIQIRPFLEVIAREIQFSIQYIRSNYSDQLIGGLYCCGLSSLIQNFDVYLEEKLDLKVSYFPIPEKVQFPSKNLFQDKSKNNDRIHTQKAVVGSLSSGYCEPDPVNMLPLEYRTKKFERMQKYIIGCVAFSSLIIFIFLFLNLQFKINNYKKRFENSLMQLDLIRGVLPLRQEAEFLRGLQTFYLSKEVPVYGVLKAISSAVPPKVLLDNLFIQVENRELVVSGFIEADQIESKKILQEFIQNLEDFMFISSIKTIYLKKNEEQYEFRIQGVAFER